MWCGSKPVFFSQRQLDGGAGGEGERGTASLVKATSGEGRHVGREIVTWNVLWSQHWWCLCKKVTASGMPRRTSSELSYNPQRSSERSPVGLWKLQDWLTARQLGWTVPNILHCCDVWARLKKMHWRWAHPSWDEEVAMLGEQWGEVLNVFVRRLLGNLNFTDILSHFSFHPLPQCHMLQCLKLSALSNNMLGCCTGFGMWKGLVGMAPTESFLLILKLTGESPLYSSGVAGSKKR